MNKSTALAHTSVSRHLLGSKLLSAILLIIPLSAVAVNRTWVGPAGGDISDGQNWEPPSFVIIDDARFYTTPSGDDILTIGAGAKASVRSLVESSLTILPQAEVNVLLGAYIRSRDVENQGRLVFSADSYSYWEQTHLYNMEGGLVEIGSATSFSSLPKSIINRGHIRYTGEIPIDLGGNSEVQRFENHGVVETIDGLVEVILGRSPTGGTNFSALVGGIWRSSKPGTRFSLWNAVLSNPIVEGVGEMRFYQGTVNLNSSHITTNMVLDGSELEGTNSFTGILTIRSSFGIGGLLYIPPGAELRLEGPGVYPSARIRGHLVNEGTIVIPDQILPVGSSPLEYTGGMGIENRDGGVLEIAYPEFRFSGPFTNRGVVRYIGQAPWNPVGTRVENHGLIESIHAGIRGGRFELYSTSRLRAPILDQNPMDPWIKDAESEHLNGTVEALFGQGFRPVPGQRFTILDFVFGGYSGRFSNARTEVSDGVYFELEYFPKRVDIVARAAPVAVDDELTLLANGFADVTVLANDNGRDGESLTVVAFSQGGRGTVSPNSDGTLRYTPAINFVGADSFSYTVADAFEITSTATVNVTVLPVAPRFTQVPSAQVVKSGQTAIFSAEASGAPTVAYQWYFANKALNGESSGTLAVPDVSMSDEGLYFVVASNAAGSVTSAPVQLRMIQVPLITVPPNSQIVGAGSSVALQVEATSEGGLSYQWRFNGEDIPGATGVVHNIAVAEVASVGRYTVVVTNEAGSVESAPANIGLFGVETFVGTVIVGQVGASYRIDVREALDPENVWRSVTTVTLSNSTTVWIDEDSPKYPRRFYRAVLVSP